MLRIFLITLSLLFSTAVMAHSDSKWTKGSQGGHIVDAGGGNQHWELKASGNELTLYVLDAKEKPVDVSTGSATAQVLLKGKVYKVTFKAAGLNVLKATGSFQAAKGMRVIVKTKNIGGKSYQARLAPLN